jgi:sialate O-acetylesterase
MQKALALPKTGMAVTIDVGDLKDIHPKNKQAVGHRLALWALATVYGEKLEYSGPTVTGHEVRDGAVIVHLGHAAGLAARDGDLRGFEIAGADKQWHPAAARIDGTSLVVSSDDVKQPAAVRYAWKDDTDANLVNGAGLPASPFRTAEF